MNIKKLECPCCGGAISADVKGRTSVFCSYCGQQIAVDDGRREFTFNKNVTINKHTSHTETYVDQAEIIKSNNQAKSERSGIRVALIMIILPLVIGIGFLLYFSIAGNIAESKGKINAGDSSDLIGEHYKTVVSHFEAAGFTNIEVIDLDDAGIAFWNEEKVKTISVGGSTSFDSYDYFDPETKVVISYH